MNTARSLRFAHASEPANSNAEVQRVGPVGVRRRQVFSIGHADPIAAALDRALDGLRAEEGERFSNRAIALRMGVDEKRIREWRSGVKTLSVGAVFGMGERVWLRFVEEMGK